MYFKENEYDQMISRGRSDERVVGKVNLWTGVLALILLIGAVAVILLLSIGKAGGRWGPACWRRRFLSGAVGPGAVLKKRTRPESRLDVKSRE